MYKISVVIPCYNLGHYLDACLDSIARQPVGKVEYIFINDGSTDETLPKLKSFCEERTSYCNIIDQCNSGVSAARNAAINVCNGEYIYILDGDDILTVSAIEDMLNDIEISDADMIISNVILLKASGEEELLRLPIKTGIYSPKELFRSVKVFPTIPQNLYRTEIVKQQRLTFDKNLKYGEVYEFTLKFLCYAKNVYVSDSCFFKYVMRGGSATHSPNFSKDLTILDTLKKYNQVGRGFHNYSSFKVTALRMLLAFSYNKYAKLRISSPEALKNITRIFENEEVQRLCREVYSSSNSPIKERILALYCKTTGVKGYKFLVKLLKILK